MKPESELRQTKLFNMAVVLAPAFRDKYDFQDPEKDYAGMASHAFKAAEAILKEYEARNKAIEEAEAEAERKAKEDKK